MKRYLSCRWAIDEDTVRCLERLNRRSGISLQRLVNDVLLDFLDDPDQRRLRRRQRRDRRAA